MPISGIPGKNSSLECLYRDSKAGFLPAISISAFQAGISSWDPHIGIPGRNSFLEFLNSYSRKRIPSWNSYIGCPGRNSFVRVLTPGSLYSFIRSDDPNSHEFFILNHTFHTISRNSRATAIVTNSNGIVAIDGVLVNLQKSLHF